MTVGLCYLHRHLILGDAVFHILLNFEWMLIEVYWGYGAIANDSPELHNVPAAKSGGGNEQLQGLQSIPANQLLQGRACLGLCFTPPNILPHPKPQRGSYHSLRNDNHPSLSISGVLGLWCLCQPDAHSFCQLDRTRNSQDWAVHTFERLTQKKALQHSKLITPTQETQQHRACLPPWSSGYRVGSEDILYRWSRSEWGDRCQGGGHY